MTTLSITLICLVCFFAGGIIGMAIFAATDAYDCKQEEKKKEKAKRKEYEAAVTNKINAIYKELGIDEKEK